METAELIDTMASDIAEMIRRTQPRFGDIVVGDINDEKVGLLEKAIAGDSRAKRELILMVERQHARRREFAAELARATGMTV